MIGESFTKREVNKENLRVSSEVSQAPRESVFPAETSSAENIIGASDRATKEELVSALGLMVNRIGMPMTVLEEFEGDQTKIDTVNVLAGEYLAAVKALDVHQQQKTAEELRMMLG